jgi:hypothetical protein
MQTDLQPGPEEENNLLRTIVAIAMERLGGRMEYGPADVEFISGRNVDLSRTPTGRLIVTLLPRAAAVNAQMVVVPQPDRINGQVDVPVDSEGGDPV